MSVSAGQLFLGWRCGATGRCCCLQVSFSCEARTPAYDGSQCSGFKFFSITPQQQLTLQLGQAPLPAGLEAAISQMSKGETAVFVVPASQLQAPAASSSAQQGARGQQTSSSQQQHQALIPQPPAKAVQVELRIQLHDLVQVREAHNGELLHPAAVQCMLQPATMTVTAAASAMQRALTIEWEERRGAQCLGACGVSLCSCLVTAGA